MDVLDDVFNTLELRSELLSRTEISSPWRFRFEASQDAQFHVINFGGGYVCVDDVAEPVQVNSGDVIILPFGDGHEICDSLDSPLTKSVVMDHCNHDSFQLFPFAGEEPVTVLLCGIFYFASPSKHPLLQSLPRIIHVPGENGRLVDGFAATLEMIAYESKHQRPGASTLIQRLTDMLFIQAIRAWIETQSHEQPVWLDALRDPQIGAALHLLHQQINKPWTVAELASHVALSRSAFSLRFTELVGEPPIRYLTRWRMIKASGLLRAGFNVAEVTHRVGYESEVSFRKAFKRETGVPPGQFRQQSG